MTLFSRAAAMALLFSAGTASAAGITIDTPFARATAPLARTGAAYATLVNAGKADDRLLGGSTPVAAALELHTTLVSGGVMRMRPLTDGVVVPAGKSVSFAPGGMHFMLMDLKQPLRAGETIPAMLRFERAGEVKVVFEVVPAGAAAPARH